MPIFSFGKRKRASRFVCFLHQNMEENDHEEYFQNEFQQKKCGRKEEPQNAGEREQYMEGNGVA